MNILNIIKKYNDIFEDPYKGKPKFLIVEYKNINDVNIKLIFKENEPILIDDIKSFVEVKYGIDDKWKNVTDM